MRESRCLQLELKPCMTFAVLTFFFYSTMNKENQTVVNAAVHVVLDSYYSCKVTEGIMENQPTNSNATV